MPASATSPVGAKGRRLICVGCRGFLSLLLVLTGCGVASHAPHRLVLSTGTETGTYYP
ncbi:MAG: hypothetical protein AAGF97_10360 [Planctomycetota bacterium]